MCYFSKSVWWTLSGLKESRKKWSYCTRDVWCLGWEKLTLLQNSKKYQQKRGAKLKGLSLYFTKTTMYLESNLFL